MEGSPTKGGDGSDKNKADSESNKKRLRERGPVGRLFFKVGERIGVVEQTRLAPEFLAQINGYTKYQIQVESCVFSLESIVQNDPSILSQGKIEAAEKSDPYEVLAKSIKAFRQFQPEDKKESMVTVEAIIKRLAIMHRELQNNARKAIDGMHQFITTVKSEMNKEREKLMKARDVMDDARHALKQTKTTEQVEEKGKQYERTVHEFDVQAAKVAAFPENLPNDKKAHRLEIFDFFDILSDFHRVAAALLTDYLAELGVDSPCDVVIKAN
ncbi:hypothetical protein AB6A40_003728 [Gnathostoma spinigerum]|uniref:BAR domain-containing protein n=1 Tax=Gnathostoma spinigerum TaxID=75299 RepID=A0ABD6EFX8_9BILA